MIDTSEKPRRARKAVEAATDGEPEMTLEEQRYELAEILGGSDVDSPDALAQRGRMGLASIEDHIPDATEMVAEDSTPWRGARLCHVCDVLIPVDSDEVLAVHYLAGEGTDKQCAGALSKWLPRNPIVTAYDHNGEAIDIEVGRVIPVPPDPLPAPSASNTPPAGSTLQVALPGFPPGTKVDKVVIAFGGTIELDPTVEEHRKLLAAMKWKESIDLSIVARVRDLALQERGDDRARGALKVTSARLVDPAFAPSDDVLPVENPCSRCRETPVYGMDMFCADCLDAMAAEDTGPCVKCGDLTDSFVLRRCEHCFAEDGTPLILGLCGTCQGEGELREFECWEHRENPNEGDTPSVASAFTEALADAIAAEAAE